MPCAQKSLHFVCPAGLVSTWSTELTHALLASGVCVLQSRRCGSQPDPPRGATTPLWSLWCKALPQNQALSTGGVVSCSSLVFFDTLGYRSLKFALAYPERMAEQRGAAALAEVQGMFPHLMPAQAAADAPMEPAPLTKPRATGKGGGAREAPQLPQGKGQNTPAGKSG